MRPLLALALAAVPAATLAQPNAEELRAMAQAGDVAGVEAAFDDAVESIRTGELTHDDLRVMSMAFTVSDPRIVDFTLRWIAAEPESPHARAIRAFQLYDEAWRLRGEGFISETWPEALDAANARWNEAMTLAMGAYRLAPDHAPASDAVFRLQLVTKALSDQDFEAMVDRVLAATHDAGSLVRAQGLSLPAWGGGGAVEVAERCERVAHLVEGVEGYDEAVCFAHAVFADQYPDLRHTAAETVLSGPADLFEPYWVEAALLATSLVEPANLAARVRDPAFVDVDLAGLYDMFDPPSSAEDSVYHQTLARAYAAARATLAVDPMNLWAIDTLLEGASVQGSPARANAPDDAERERLARARIEAAPFDPESWRALVHAHHGGTSPWPLDHAAEVAGANAVVYSRYAPHLLQSYAQERAAVIANAERDLAAGHITPEQHAEALAASLCPIVRADRILRVVCESPTSRDWGCSNVNFAAPEWQEALDLVEAGGQCLWDRNAPLALIAFEPRPLPEE